MGYEPLYHALRLNMVSVRVIFLRRFYFFKLNLLYFWGVFSKTNIPLALVGYEMIIANSYPTRTCGIIANYPMETGS